MLNPDIFAWPNLGGTEERRLADEELVENAAAFLLEALIPNMVHTSPSILLYSSVMLIHIMDILILTN